MEDTTLDTAEVTAEEPTPLWDKHPDDLTVGDVVKANIAILAASAAVGASLVGISYAAGAAADKYQTWKAKQRLRKLEEEIVQDSPEEEN